MEEWQYRFPEITKAQWLQRINSDLKGKSISTLQSEWWPGEVRVPFHHKEDKVDPPVELPAHFFTAAPLLTEWIDTRNRNETDINKEVLLALQYGAQSIILHVGKDLPSISKILENVIQDYISISVESDESLDGIAAYITPNIKTRLQNGQSPLHHTSFSKYVYSMSSEGDWTEQTANVLKDILDRWRILNESGFGSSFLQNCILRYTPGTDYLKQIIQTRVIHIVWQRIFTTHNIQPDPSHVYLECHILPDPQCDPDKYLIQAASSALAASLTGIHALCIHHMPDQNTAGYYSRINRNISHLLHLESEMYKGIDPLAGSYSIDYYTRKWSDDILTKLAFP